MSNPTKMHAIERLARQIMDAVGIMNNQYFRALENGSMSQISFAHSQEQFFHAVSFYSRPMGILVARLPNSSNRMGILHNLLDEHGDFNVEQSHQTTFNKFLNSLGTKADEDTMMSPAVHSFNSVLTSVCAFEDIEVGVACLGIIELAFAEISAKIGRAVVERGFVAENDLVHYKLHAELDEKHADDFFKLLYQSWKKRSRRAYIKNGLELGAFIFDRLYSELLIFGNDRA